MATRRYSASPNNTVESIVEAVGAATVTQPIELTVDLGAVKLTGRKENQKIYRRHSGYEGGLREERARLVRQRHPERLVEDAVHGMLPKTKLGEAMYRKLKVYAGPDHPHTAQKPSKLEVA